MAYKLKKMVAPFGTKEAPLFESSYSESVEVVDGLCEVHEVSTRDYLLKLGYEEISQTGAGSPEMAGSAPHGASGKAKTTRGG